MYWRGVVMKVKMGQNMYVNKSETGGRVKIQGEEVGEVDEFKYLLSTIQSKGQ